MVMRIASGRVQHAVNLTEMEFQIHCMEIEAYGAVLRAFIAQSEVLSWGKEELISNLRKELRVSDVEHREILAKINSDDTIKSIRESRQATNHHHGLLPNAMTASDFHSNSMVNVSRKKMKAANVTVSSSPMYLPRSQLSPATFALSTVEDQWGNNNAIFPQANAAQTMKSISNTTKERGPVTIQVPNNGLRHLGSHTANSGFDTIEIRSTDKLIEEIERVCGVENPDPANIELAKSILKEHERALIEALEKLADVADDDDAPDHWHQQVQHAN